MSSRIDAVASRLEAAIRMNQVSRTMGRIVTGMDKAMASMDMGKVMDTFCCLIVSDILLDFNDHG